MPRGLPQKVKDNIAKCQASALAAVDAYNRPGPRFRTAQYLILIVIAWTALFHALFFRRGRNPWYRKRGVRAVRYEKVDGEYKHWDLTECLKQFYGGRNPAARRNLEFLLALRNKIEHRHLPELDASLYGECQAALMNLDELLAEEFGQKYALQEQLAVSLQFSRVLPEQKRAAARSLAKGAAKNVVEYVQKFRGSLPSNVLNSMKYSFNVFLVPKVANREKGADVAVEFVKVDEANADELDRLSRLNVLIREKHIPIANLDLLKPSQVVSEVADRVPFRFTMSDHTACWKYHEARPVSGARDPRRTKQQYCVFDEPHGDYVYTRAWVERISSDFSDERKVSEILGRSPRRR